MRKCGSTDVAAVCPAIVDDPVPPQGMAEGKGLAAVAGVHFPLYTPRYFPGRWLPVVSDGWKLSVVVALVVVEKPSP